MSVDYYLYCKKCKKRTESSIAAEGFGYAFKLWELDVLKGFLKEHQRHDIVFEDEHAFEINDNDEIEYYPEEPK